MPASGPSPRRGRNLGLWAAVAATAVALVVVGSALLFFPPSPPASGFQTLWSRSLGQNNDGIGAAAGGVFYTYYVQDVGVNASKIPIQGYFAVAIDLATGRTLWTSAPLRVVNLYCQGCAQLVAVVGQQVILGVYYSYGSLALASFNLTTGDTLREANVSLAEPAGFYASQQVYPIHDGAALLWAPVNSTSIYVQSLNLSTFASEWVQTVPGAPFPSTSGYSSPVETDLTGSVVDGELCVGEGWTGPYIGNPNGTAFCLNATTGSVLWQRTVSGVSVASGIAIDPSGIRYLDNSTGALAIQGLALTNGATLPGFAIASQGNVSIVAHQLSEVDSELIVGALRPFGWFQAYDAVGRALWNSTLGAPSASMLQSAAYILLSPYALSGNQILLGDLPDVIYAAHVNYPQSLRIVNATTGATLWDRVQTISVSSISSGYEGTAIGFFQISQSSGPYLLYYDAAMLFCAKP